MGSIRVWYFPATFFWNVSCYSHIIAIVISAHHIAPFCGLINYGEISNCSAHCTGVIILALAFYILRYSLLHLVRLMKNSAVLDIIVGLRADILVF